MKPTTIEEENKTGALQFLQKPEVIFDNVICKCGIICFFVGVMIGVPLKAIEQMNRDNRHIEWDRKKKTKEEEETEKEESKEFARYRTRVVRKVELAY